MAATASARAMPKIVPILANESSYVGVDIGKRQHVAGFISNTLLTRHKHFEACEKRIQSYVPLEQCFVLMEKTGHYHKALEQYLLEFDVSVYGMHARTGTTKRHDEDRQAGCPATW